MTSGSSKTTLTSIESRHNGEDRHLVDSIWNNPLKIELRVSKLFLKSDADPFKKRG